MTVYELLVEDGFQSLDFEDHEAGREWLKKFKFDGSPLKRRWKPPVLCNRTPKRKKPDLWAFPCRGTPIAFEPQAAELLSDVLKRAGELLPFTLEGRELVVLNVTRVVDCLDAKKSDIPKDLPWVVRDFVFKPKKVTEPLFKILQQAEGTTKVAEGVADPSEEFKAIVDASGLKGIRFRQLWSTD